MRPDPLEAVLRGLDRTVTEVRHDLTVVHRLQAEDLTLFEDLLPTKPEIVAVFGPPRDSAVVRLWILRVHHERRHQLDEGRLRAFEPRVVQFGLVEVYHLRVLQLNLAVAVIPFAAELEALQHILAKRKYRRVISVQVGVDAPLRRLLLFPLVFPAVHDGLVSKRRVTAVDAEIVRVQRVPSAGASLPAGGRGRRRPRRRAGRSRGTGGCPTDCVPRETSRTGRARRRRDWSTPPRGSRDRGADRERAGWRSRSRSTGGRCSPSAAPTALAESPSSVGPPLVVVLDVLECRAPGLRPAQVWYFTNGSKLLVTVMTKWSYYIWFLG